MPNEMDQRIRIIMLRERELDGERNPCVLEACEVALRMLDSKCRCFSEMSLPKEYLNDC